MSTFSCLTQMFRIALWKEGSDIWDLFYGEMNLQYFSKGSVIEQCIK